MCLGKGRAHCNLHVDSMDLELSIENAGFGKDVRCRSYRLSRSKPAARTNFMIRSMLLLVALLSCGYILYWFWHDETIAYRYFWVLGLSVYARTTVGRIIAEESLLVTQKLGVQIERIDFSGRRSYEFVDMHTIEDAVINEGITRCKIVHYMAFLRSDRKDPLLVFQNFPPRKELELICRGTRAVLGLNMRN